MLSPALIPRSVRMARILPLAVLILVLPAVAAQETKKKAYFGVQIKLNDDKEVLVQIAFTDSPAAKAGLKAGDVILKINDVKPADLQAAVKVIQSLTPGKKVKLLIRREMKEK